MDLVIIGAGGFGREVLDVARDSAASSCSEDLRLRFRGFVDDGSPDLQRLERIGADYLGSSTELARLRGAAYVVGVGNPKVRAQLAARADEAGLIATTLVHPSATIGADVTLGPGTVIAAGVRITTNVRIGRHVHLNLNATVGHDAVLEDFATVNPLAAISGDVVLKQGATIGTTACVNQGLCVGSEAVVGAGAAVVKNVEPATTVVGVPARALGQR
ncbi:NeuD/PglB/VioB family sugar acetyltransferase [Ornithinimicrobium flavum]|uniref:NeuD/PglB/VioB family sugar acetyltransferase n=1 Tax=Ornithinimicrobium flavum TaxID=1288636 RepID=UPI00106FEB63|nr:NeuD/PglB/VioB family sugar acetyltransferase [Ornithinimicrobium flavum]